MLAVGTVEGSDESSVCSETEGEALTSFGFIKNDGSGKCALSAGEGGDSQQGEGEPWLLDTGATQHFSYSSSGMTDYKNCLLYTSPSPRDATLSRMPSSA